ncbi:MAG: HAD family hydrolase [Anaeroplasmataceae bacterium]|nr:HAD family hydrolase [Anaeroplasmataceae bacterium]
MEIYLDFENTLLNEERKPSPLSIKILNQLTQNHEVTVLTTSSIQEVATLFPIPSLRIVSTLENKLYEKNVYFYTPLKNIDWKALLAIPHIYTLYGIEQDTAYILKYQERMKYFYPAHRIQLCTSLPSTIAAFVLAIYHEGIEEVKTILKDFKLEILARDHKKTLFLVSLDESSKEAWLLRLKKSPAIGIGDSLSDYSFIKHCEVQVSMKNGEQELKDKCPYQTSKTNQEDGALDFIVTYLKHQQA